AKYPPTHLLSPQLHSSTFPLPIPSLSSLFFNHTPTTEIYTLSLHDALPIFLFASCRRARSASGVMRPADGCAACRSPPARPAPRSEEHTSELQSRGHLVCRLLLEKKNNRARG